MKSYYLFFACCLLSSTTLLAQKNAPVQRGYSREHKDAQGNVIGRDSVVTYYWSSDGNTNMPDSMFNFQQLPNGFSFNFGSPRGFGMPNDTTQSKRGMMPQSPFDNFFNDSFFNFGFPPDIQQMMEQQQRQLNEMMRRQPSAPAPNAPQPEPKANEKKKYKSVQI